MVLGLKVIVDSPVFLGAGRALSRRGDEGEAGRVAGMERDEPRLVRRLAGSDWGLSRSIRSSSVRSMVAKGGAGMGNGSVRRRATYTQRGAKASTCASRSGSNGSAGAGFLTRKSNEAIEQRVKAEDRRSSVGSGGGASEAF
jgi:hypothetical protein